MKCLLVLYCVGGAAQAFCEVSVAYVRFVSGKVEHRRPISDFMRVDRDSLLRNKSEIKTHRQAYLELLVVNRCVRVFPESLVSISALSGSDAEFVLHYGRVMVCAADGGAPGQVLVRASFASVVSKEAQDSFSFSLDAKKYLTLVNYASPLLLQEDDSPYFLNVPARSRARLVSPLRNVQFEVAPESSTPDEDLEVFESASHTDILAVKTTLEEDPFFENERFFLEENLYIKQYRQSRWFQLVGSSAFAFVDAAYFVFGFYPQLSLPNVWMGLRFEMYFPLATFDGMNSLYNSGEWSFDDGADSVDDALNKVESVQVGGPLFDYHVALQELENISFGQGLNMFRYRNTIFFPHRRKLGFFASVNLGALSFMGFLGHVTRGELFGFQMTVSSPQEAHSPQFSFNFAGDTNPLGQMHELMVFALSIDGALPVYQLPQHDLSVILLLELAFQGVSFQNAETLAAFQFQTRSQLFEKSPAFLAGARVELEAVHVLVKFRYLVGRYVNEYFDSLYELRRPEKALQLLASRYSDAYGLMFGVVGMLEGFGDAYAEFYFERGRQHFERSLDYRVYLELTSHENLSPLFVVSLFGEYLEFFDSTSVAHSRPLVGVKLSHTLLTWLDLGLGYRTFFEKTSLMHCVVGEVRFVF